MIFFKQAKMVFTLAIAVGFSLLLSACTTSDGSEVASDRECRTFQTSGSKMRRSVCMSADEWAVVDAREAERQEDADLDEFFRSQRDQGTTTVTAPSLNSPFPN